MATQPTILRPEERPAGALAHLFTAIPAWGLLANIGLWIYHKERSRDLVFHVQQAMVFQALLLVFWVIPASVLYLLAKVVGVIVPSLGGFLGSMNQFLMVLIYTAYVAVCLWGAVQTWLGKEFFYPIIGRRMFEGSLTKTPVEE
ncbi:MAG: DUF4870 domain-containing protein [Candidatus Sumerlaeia bacterium]|nr:DUF4870 domain-containing protein [Candidatus Sumerlaeia bacterium]